MLLQELGAHTAASNAQTLLPQHKIFSTTHQRWRRGKGVAIGIHEDLQRHVAGPPKIYHDAQVVHIQLRGLLPVATHRLHILCCYLPWAGSKQLEALDLAARYSMLQQIIEDTITAQPDCHVIIAGDWNAKVGQEQAISIAAAAAILSNSQPYSISTNRQQQLVTLDAAGAQLNDLCCACNLINLTGLTEDDSPAAASYFKGNKHERIDHFLVSPGLIPHVTGHIVCSHLLGSDHVPLQLTICLHPAPPPTESEDDASPPSRADQTKMQFIIPSDNVAVIKKYQRLVSEEAVWQPLLDLAAEPCANPDNLLHCFQQILFDTAIAAGYRVKHMTPGQLGSPPRPHTSSKYNVWHDGLCRQLQSQIRAINRHTANKAELEERQRLQTEYSKRVRKLLRRHRFEQGVAQLAAWRSNRNLFWRNYKPHAKGCPFTAKAMARHFQKKMNSYASPATSGDANVAPEAAHTTHASVDVTQIAPTLQEIVTAIKSMQSHAAGVDGIPTALFKPWAPSPGDEDRSETVVDDEADPGTATDAVGHIAQGLSLVFDCISRSSTVPAEWCTGLLSPIYKNKGDLADIANYRPLSIPTVACRLWSSITNQKLMKVCSDKGLLPDVMFGFTQGKSCSDPLFILRHLADMHRGKQGEVFAVAFMDLSGAYDSVCRQLLFDKLLKLVGLSEHSLTLLRSLYHNTKCIVKGQYSLSEPFTVLCGVRQGCPLSTTLFNLFISDLHSYITQRCPGLGVRVRSPGYVSNGHHSLLTDLGYADDIALCVNKPGDLQRILDCFADYCMSNGLIINPNKCETVVFSGGGAWPRASWTVKELNGSGCEHTTRPCSGAEV